ncbi:nitrate- and nitrite sensing domain-containing protein [Nocardia huaxiensis]|uniref:histidine kinase n=1 Tax=Nocardia huaxiensis TaxID=2755382 RepID=A0A7D6VBC5_9NOCA|nr:nitrate- and nitrite sensing domain-containing protein [Nocardia huaxiensis]QLY30222.1 nitrate- and nitrite sensing domain-containing protein [Nocardia huaxiensis]
MLESLRRGAERTRAQGGKRYARLGVRARLLAIVLVSSVTLLVIGVGAAGYLVKTGREAQDWAELAAQTTEPGLAMVESYQDERLASLRYLAGESAAAVDMTGVRARTDAAAMAGKRLLEQGAVGLSGNRAEQLMSYGELYEKFPLFRAGVDARQVPVEQVFALYGGIIDTGPAATMYSAGVAPDADIALELTHSVPAMRAAEGLSLAIALGSYALATDNLDSRTIVEIGRAAGNYRGEVAFSLTMLRGERLAALQAITAGADWQTLTAAEEALADGRAPAGVRAWQEAGVRVRSALMQVWLEQTNAAHALARERGSETSIGSLFGGAGVLAASVLAFLIALVLANRFVARTRRLHRHTLELADYRLPELMRRLNAGEQVDPAAEVTGPELGGDEIGHVANAFNRAHLAAVSAAVAEAKTRAGVNAVFLNIAHRSQVVVHRQLTLLDEAERAEENPRQLDLLFQLDHLATRARRNAENLIILGGEQPGRRWRKPVPLMDLVRGAVAESLDYSRIRTGRLPEVNIEGKAVADLIHAMAELMDNATSFSPPNSTVEVFGSAVGKGVAVEIEDQGLGMSAEEIAQRNEMLAQPPDFSVAALTSDIRLGLFVVAKLAARHGISVRLGESMYGGIRAVMIIPAALVTEPEEPAQRDLETRAEPAVLRRQALSGRIAAQRDWQSRAAIEPSEPGDARSFSPVTEQLPVVTVAVPAATGPLPVATGPVPIATGPMPMVTADAPPATGPVPSPVPEHDAPVRRRNMWLDAAHQDSPRSPSPSDPAPQPDSVTTGGWAVPSPEPPITGRYSIPSLESPGSARFNLPEPPPGPGAGRPALPRRTRNSAAIESIPDLAPEPQVRRRSADEARSRVASVVQGSRRGRHRPS